MEKRRMRLEINGIVCGLITQESEEYMKALSEEVGSLMREVMGSSPYITREAAALTAALSCCDDAKKNGRKAASLQERVDELEVEAELWKEEKEELLKSVVDTQKDARLQERAARLEAENASLSEAAGKAQELKEEAARLEDENRALKESASIGAEALRELSVLREKVKELEPLAAQARRESEEGEKLLRLQSEIEALRKEARTAQEEARRLREAGASPALDALERQAAKAQEAGEAENAPKPEAPKEKPAPRKKRKNPLRYEEDFEQEGFVSFFEKNG